MEGKLGQTGLKTSPHPLAHFHLANMVHVRGHFYDNSTIYINVRKRIISHFSYRSILYLFCNTLFFIYHKQSTSDVVCAKAHRENSKYNSITPVSGSSPIPSPHRLIYCNFVCMYAGKTKAPAPCLRWRPFVFLVHMYDTFHAATFRIISRAELEIAALNANKQPRYELWRHMEAIPSRCTAASVFRRRSVAFKSQLILSSNELGGLV